MYITINEEELKSNGTNEKECVGCESIYNLPAFENDKLCKGCVGYIEDFEESEEDFDTEEDIDEFDIEEDLT